MNTLSRWHPFRHPLAQQLPVPIIQSRIVSTISRDNQPDQASALLDCHLPMAKSRFVDPAFLVENFVPVFQRDVVDEPLEEVKSGLVKNAVFSAVKVNDRAS